MNRLTGARSLRHAVFVLTSLAGGGASAADIDWEGWSFDVSTNDNASGLVLRDVSFEGRKILDRASMPVMRVEYERDVCGPYADILSSRALRPATQGAPESVCDGRSQCTRTFTRDGERMLEVGSNWQLGEYQIYQTYYFSEDGYFDARVYSRGLQCSVDHAHHAHWLFDFDIGDAENDRVRRADGSVPATEFNDLRAESASWRIEDTASGHAVSLESSADDGQPDDFASVDLAVRAYRGAENGRWRLGARGEIGDNYLDGESVDGADLVLWYVSHLSHSASEGPSIWHASGPRIRVAETSSPPPEPEPEPEPEPPAPSGDNLLANGDFEAMKAGWFDCGPETATTAEDGAGTDGSRALRIGDGGCLYQEVPVTAGTDYTLACRASRRGGDWTVMELSYLDEDYAPLLSRVAQITGGADYAPHVLGATVPAGTVRAVALLYSEDDTRFDDCVLSPGEIPVDPEPPGPGPAADNLLRNGGFEQALAGWNSCAGGDLIETSNDAAGGNGALSVRDGGCLYQEFAVTPGVSYALRCTAKRTGDTYTSVTHTMMDSAYTALERRELPVGSAQFASYNDTLIAPAGSARGAVTLYSEAPGVFDDCEVRAD